MESSTIIKILLVLLPLFGAGIGYLIKQIIEKKKELLNEINKERREYYFQFISLIIDIFKPIKSVKTTNFEYIERLREIYKKYILFASPEVINAFSDYMQYLYREDQLEDIIDINKLREHQSLLTRIMHHMRKEIGLSNKNLGQNGERLLRAITADFDELFKN